MEDQQKFNQLLNEINVYKQQGDLIQQQIELVRASIAEVDALTNTLDDLEGKDSVEAFVKMLTEQEKLLQDRKKILKTV